MSKALSYRYEEDRSGGILITRSRYGIDEAEVYLQPGDDANSLRSDLEAAEKLPDGKRDEVIRYLLDQYDVVMQPIEQTRGPDADVDMREPEQQAWAKFREARDQLPRRIDKLLEWTRAAAEKLDPGDEQGQIKLRGDFRAGTDEAFGIITEGPDRGADRHILALKKAGIPLNLIFENPDVRKYHEVVDAQWERINDFRNKLDAQRKAQLRERGKEILKALDDKVPGAEISEEREAVAVFWKHGFVAINENSPYLKQVLADIKQKNLKQMLELIGHNSQNPASQEVFTRMTGIVLGKTQKERVAQLEAWAGPEKVAAVQEAKKQREAEITRNWLSVAYKKLDGVRVQVDEPALGGIVTVSGQDYLHIKISHGRDHVYATKSGAAVSYRLHNPQSREISYFRSKRFNDFAKATLAIAPDGDVRKALGSIGIHTPDKSLSDFLRKREQVRHNEPLAQDWAKELREYPDLYSKVAGLSPDNVRALAGRLEKSVEQEVSRPQIKRPDKALGRGVKSGKGIGD